MEDYNPFDIDSGSNYENHDYRRQRRQPRKHDGDMKVELPKFDGKMQYEERNVKLVAIRLKGNASLW